VKQDKKIKMEAKELRLGNYVSVISDVLDPFLNDHGLEGIDNAFKVVGIDSFHVNVSIDGLECEFYLYEYKPILLTEERLIKFGFERIRGAKKMTWKKTVNSNVFTYDEDRYFRVNGMFVICHHIHTLQNLYFDLTNEELTIKQD